MAMPVESLAEPTTRELLEDILDVLIDIKAAIEVRQVIPAPAPIRRPGDERYGPLLEALAAALGELDVPFESAEVCAYAKSDHNLAVVLRGCGLRTPADLGARFRTLNGRWIGALRLVRDGEAWRLERRT